MSLLLATSGDIASSEVSAEGVDFDGTYDYLSRSTDLVGNVDSKTFTFSAWVYCGSNTRGARIIDFRSVAGDQGSIIIGDFGDMTITMRNSIGTTILSATAPNYTIPYLTYINILISIDLTNSANRKIYISDIDKTASFTFATYTNGFIDFTKTTWRIGNDQSLTGVQIKGRLSNVFLSYDYIDLSIEANRRLFITADGKPTPTATLKALNPILYLPMKDAATAHINEGTGGNFTLNGTIATSNRGANQDNCVASYFDGTAGYLSRTSLTGVADGKQFTIAFNYNLNTSSRSIYVLHIGNPVKFYITVESTGNISVAGYNSSGTNILFAYVNAVKLGKNGSIKISIDLSNINNRFIVLDNTILSNITWSKYVDDNIGFNSSQYYIQRIYNNTDYGIGNIGELYFDTKYIDLSTNNPFWDSVANKPKPVRQVIRETGVTPLIAMPLYASNPGKNYGTGGDFTANSAPYVGARGASEFWARSAKVGASASEGSFVKTSSLGVNARYCIVSSFFNMSQSSQIDFVTLSTSSSSFTYYISIGISGVGSGATLQCWLGEGGVTKYGLNQGSTTLTTLSLNTWYWFVFIFDSQVPSNSKWFINGVQGTALTPLTSIPTSNVLYSQYGYNKVSKNNYSSSIAHTSVYATDYIDFSQETERLKFIDAMGYPLDLGKQIEKGIIPNPLVYLPFDDSTNLGKNLGTGGSFSVVGSVSSGADFAL